MKRRGLALLVAIVTALAGLFVVSQAGASTPQYYLSLGDSLGYGFQEAKLPAAELAAAHGQDAAAVFNTGYTDDLAKLLALSGRPLTVTNYSCPGETSTTLIHGGCPWTATGLPLHNPYSGPQLAAAVTFLDAHPGQVPLITLAIGANDVLPGYPQCVASNTCPPLAPELSTLHANLVTTLAALRTAAPTAKIVVLSLYNPLGKAYPSTAPLALELDATIVVTALTHGARVADSYVPFNVLPWPGLCQLTYYCSTTDIHPTDLGYRVIAGAFYAAQR
jgi:lysophospholipase L1-like esterase